MTPLLRRLLAKDPARRPGGDEVVAYLAEIAARAEKAETEPQPGPKADTRSRLLVALVLLVAAAVAVVMIITAIPSDGETHLPGVTPEPTVAGTSRAPSP